MVRRILCILLLGSPFLFAETVVETITAAVMQIKDADSDPQVVVSPSAGGEISFSSRTSSVRTQLRLRILAFATMLQGEYQTLLSFSLPRAYVTIRLLPTKMRLTVGKAPLSWGDGAVYNAADTMSGSRIESNVSDAVLRDQSVWMLSYFLPLGTFSFFEALVAYPQFDVGFLSRFSPSEPAGVISTVSGALEPDGYAAGGRLQTKGLGVKWEFSYLYWAQGRNYGKNNPDLMYHFPSVSAQWHLGIDWYAAVVYPLPHLLKGFHPDTVEISAGLLYTDSFFLLKGLSLRLESLVKLRNLTVYLFPEVIITPDDLWSLYIRSEWKVLHDDATVIVGTRISPSTGLSIDPFVSVQVVHQQFSSANIGLQVRYIF